MKEFLISITKYLRNILLVSVIISAAVIVVSMIFRYELSDAFLYTGLICLVIGGLSVMGNINMTSSSEYFQAASASSLFLHKIAEDNFKLKDGSFRFLIFMAITGFILLVISSILGNHGL